MTDIKQSTLVVLGDLQAPAAKSVMQVLITGVRELRINITYKVATLLHFAKVEENRLHCNAY